MSEQMQPTPLEDMTPVEMMSELAELREMVSVLLSQRQFLRGMLMNVGILIAFTPEEVEQFTGQKSDAAEGEFNG